MIQVTELKHNFLKREAINQNKKMKVLVDEILEEYQQVLEGNRKNVMEMMK